MRVAYNFLIDNGEENKNQSVLVPQTGTPVYVWKNNKIEDLTKEQRPPKKSKSKRT